MKKITSVILISTLLFACNKVKNPVIPKPCNLKDIHITKTNATTVDIRKVLVQDYTGHKCGNCPRGAEAMEAIHVKYPGKIIPMSVHAGNQFSPPVLPDFPEDFRTAVGNNWDVKLAMSANGLPKGSVNWAQTPYYQPRTAWDGLAAAQLAIAQKAKLLLTSNLDTNMLSVSIDVKVTMIAESSLDVKLSLVITEDSIIGRQTDYNPPVGATVENGDEIPDYVFMYVLRGDINGVSGETIKAAPVKAGEEITKTYCGNLSPWPLNGSPNKKKLKNTAIVAILYTVDSNGMPKEVLQAESMYVK